MTSLLLDFGAGHLAGTCSTQLVPYQRVQIFGTRGRIEIEIPFNAPPDRPCADLRGPAGPASTPSSSRSATSTRSRAISSRGRFSTASPRPVPLEDAVANMACIDALVRSAETGRWEVPSELG